MWTRVKAFRKACPTIETRKLVVMTLPGFCFIWFMQALLKLDLKDLKTLTSKGWRVCNVWAGKDSSNTQFSRVISIKSIETWELWPSCTSKTGQVGGILFWKQCKPVKKQFRTNPATLTAFEWGVWECTLIPSTCLGHRVDHHWGNNNTSSCWYTGQYGVCFFPSQQQKGHTHLSFPIW